MKFIFKIHNDRSILDESKILVLDRDGVVIKDTGYPHNIKKLDFEIKNIERIKTFIKEKSTQFVVLQLIKVALVEIIIQRMSFGTVIIILLKFAKKMA